MQTGLFLGEFTIINHGEKQSAISVRYRKENKIKYLLVYKSVGKAIWKSMTAQEK